jgi:fatty-acyl-CoA synthase
MSVLPALGETLARSSRKYGDRDAIVYPEKNVRWTYAKFDERVTRFADALADRGIDPGDRISVFLHNSAEFAVAVYGIVRAGAVFTPINYRLPAGELEYIISDSDPYLLVFEEATRETLEAARSGLDVGDYVYVDDDRRTPPGYADGFYALLSETSPSSPDISVSPEDTYGIVYTSGTTGRPKGVVHTHEQMTYFNLLYTGQLGLTEDDHGIVLMPMYHCSALHAGLFTRVNIGSKNVILHDFDPELSIEQMEAEGATNTFVASRSWGDMRDAARERGFDSSEFDTAVFGGSQCRNHF